jgi:indole-3-glycerol phosphate synthase
MADFIDVLAQSVKETINSGYYEAICKTGTSYISLKKAIVEAKNAPVITEIKTASPSAGIIRENAEAGVLAESMEKGGAIGISVLTEPKHFNGSLFSLLEARKAVKIPILMKDIIIDPLQLEAAAKAGANAVLLIIALFDRGYSDYNMHKMIARAHSAGLEVLLETHNEEEFCSAVKTHADLIGINNRDLTTLKVDLNVTKRILEGNDMKDKIIVSESGIHSPVDLHFLSECGAQAFLIGSAIMLSNNIEEKVAEFVSAL